MGMSITDAKSGKNAYLSYTGLGQYKGIVLRAVIAFLEECDKALRDTFTPESDRRTAFLEAALVDPKKYEEWDDTRFVEGMASLSSTALTELRRWKREPRGDDVRFGGFGGVGGFESAILSHGMAKNSLSSILDGPTDPLSEMLDAPFWIGRLPKTCPPPLEMLGLRGIWAFVSHADNSSISTAEEAREIKVVLGMVHDKEWDEITDEMLEVFGNCADDSFITWG